MLTFNRGKVPFAIINVFARIATSSGYSCSTYSIQEYRPPHMSSILLRRSNPTEPTSLPRPDHSDSISHAYQNQASVNLMGERERERRGQQHTVLSCAATVERDPSPPHPSCDVVIRVGGEGDKNAG